MTDQPALLPAPLPTVPGLLAGIVGTDPWRVQCAECGRIGTGRNPHAAITDGGIHFHHTPWPDGTNPRLCRHCRARRGCGCWCCDRERNHHGRR